LCHHEVVLRRALPPLALAALLLLPACSSGARSDQPSAAPAAEIEPSPSRASPEPSPGPSRAEVLLAEVTDGATSYVAIPRERLVPLWERPGEGDPDFRLDSRNPRGGLTPMLIEDGRLDERGALWLEVLLPIRPNGATAWVPAEAVRFHQRRDRIEVDLSERILEHYRDGELVNRFRVGIGQPQYPTAVGTFYVWVKVPYADPAGPYGVYALGLSGFSPVLSDWPSNGRMAVHGTPYAGNRGQAVSHGCVRVYNPQMETLTRVPLGTPVVISA
jgi:lipoprotein-anchoring transpeptidase ErfK/SrfK